MDPIMGTPAQAFNLALLGSNLALPGAALTPPQSAQPAPALNPAGRHRKPKKSQQAYQEEEDEEEEADEACDTPPKQRRSGRRRGGWEPEMGEASKKALVAAEARAAELADRGITAFAKIMCNSMVNGGYWCSAPRGLAKALGRTNREERSGKVELIVADDGGREAVGEEEVWDSVWLPHNTSPNAWGFSGGWRGFAIDWNLFYGDSVVYEVVPPAGHAAASTQHPASTIKIHIFRARSYEEPGAGASPAAHPCLPFQNTRRVVAEKRRQQEEKQRLKRQRAQQQKKKGAQGAGTPEQGAPAPKPKKRRVAAAAQQEVDGQERLPPPQQQQAAAGPGERGQICSQGARQLQQQQQQQQGDLPSQQLPAVHIKREAMHHQSTAGLAAPHWWGEPPPQQQQQQQLVGQAKPVPEVVELLDDSEDSEGEADVINRDAKGDASSSDSVIVLNAQLPCTPAPGQGPPSLSPSIPLPGSSQAAAGHAIAPTAAPTAAAAGGAAAGGAGAGGAAAGGAGALAVPGTLVKQEALPCGAATPASQLPGWSANTAAAFAGTPGAASLKWEAVGYPVGLVAPSPLATPPLVPPGFMWGQGGGWSTGCQPGSVYGSQLPLHKVEGQEGEGGITPMQLLPRFSLGAAPQQGAAGSGSPPEQMPQQQQQQQEQPLPVPKAETGAGAPMGNPAEAEAGMQQQAQQAQQHQHQAPAPSQAASPLLPASTPVLQEPSNAAAAPTTAPPAAAAAADLNARPAQPPLNAPLLAQEQPSRAGPPAAAPLPPLQQPAAGSRAAPEVAAPAAGPVKPEADSALGAGATGAGLVPLLASLRSNEAALRAGVTKELVIRYLAIYSARFSAEQKREAEQSLRLWLAEGDYEGARELMREMVEVMGRQA